MNDSSFNKYLFALSNLGFNQTFKLALNNLFSINHYYILKKNLSSLNTGNQLKSNIEIKKVNNDDLNDIVKTIKMLDPIDRKEIVSRILFYKSGFKNCYVAKKKDDIAYIQWLIYPYENSIIKENYQRIFYPLGENQVMIENAFTFPKYRGIGLMEAVTLKLLSIAKKEGYKFAVGYIRKDRIISLNEFIKMGFKITKMVREYKFLGMTTRTL